MDFFTFEPITPEAENPTLEANLSAIGRHNPRAASLIKAAVARPDAEFGQAADGAVTLTLAGRALCSKRAPITEAQRLAAQVDTNDKPTACVLGFGAGHHVRILAEALGEHGLVAVYEPDIPLLRAVFEKIDCSAWIEKTNFRLFTDHTDSAIISEAVKGAEALLALGVEVIEHPASIARLGKTGVAFASRFTDVLRAVRTNVVTSLVQSKVTLRNAFMNADHYASCPGIADLAGVARGRSAILVAAGPSLAKNLDQLEDPSLRDRAVIIAAQTVLKPMLRRGIRPHFVTALDHHEMSKRFYEGLSKKDLEGVTLVAEPKANPAILDSFAGHIRLPADDLLDQILPNLTSSGVARGVLRPGATVAHLNYYLARHLGCDPVILVGQDLGFTDGQYYGDGAAIHDVWAGELHDFTSVEQHEWERIARMKSLLRPAQDAAGRPMYTDEQMSTYLAQFEADFLTDTQQGLVVIDATEGGVAKRHTRAMPLADAIAAYASHGTLELPDAVHIHDQHRTDLPKRFREIADEARFVSAKSIETTKLLARMKRQFSNTARVNELIRRVHTIRDTVESTQPAYNLTRFLNQTGALNRFKADRKISMAPEMSELDEQAARIERDAQNVEWIAEAASEVADLAAKTAEVHAGHEPKLYRDPGDAATQVHRRVRVGAIIPVEFDTGGLGTTRSIETPRVDGQNALQLTTRRLLRCAGIAEIVLLTDDVGRTRSALGELAGDPRVIVNKSDLTEYRERKTAVASARCHAPASWRGPFGLSLFDEVYAPEATMRAVKHRSLDAAYFVGPDWVAVDPG